MNLASPACRHSGWGAQHLLTWLTSAKDLVHGQEIIQCPGPKDCPGYTILLAKQHASEVAGVSSKLELHLCGVV